MTAALPAPARERFIRIAGMLGSDAAAERENAARLATEILLKHGLTWRQVLEVGGPCPRCRPPEAAWTSRLHWREVARRLLDEHGDLPNNWETEFLHSLRHRHGLSLKQDHGLRRIGRKVWESGK